MYRDTYPLQDKIASHPNLTLAVMNELLGASDAQVTVEERIPLE